MSGKLVVPVWLAVVVLLGILAALLWIGGELHYRGCVDAVQGSYGTTSIKSYFGAEGALQDRRARAVRECSRWPL